MMPAENGRDHHTYEYELMERNVGANLVVRRGQPFQLSIKLNRNYNPTTDALSLIFNVAGIELETVGHCHITALSVLALF